MRVVFVCKGNKFRSVIAMEFFRKLCRDADSAGTYAKTDQNPIIPLVLEKFFEIKSFHKPQKFDRGKHKGMVIAMSSDVKRELENQGINAYLYNELIGRSGDVEDVEDVYENPKPEQISAHVLAVANYLWRTIPEMCRVLKWTRGG